MSDKDKSTSLAHVEESAFAIMDALDDDLVIAEIEKRVVDTWVYHFPAKEGPEIWGLSKKGVDQALEELEKQGLCFEEDFCSVVLDPSDADYLLISAKVNKYRYDRNFNRIHLGSLTGYKRQWTKEKRKDGSLATDRFYFEKGCAKALRNAKSRAISVELESKIIAFAKDKGKVKEVADKPKKVETSWEKEALQEVKDSRHKYRLGKVFAQHKALGFSDFEKVKENIASMLKISEDFSLAKFVENDKLYNEYQDLIDLQMSKEA